VCTENSILAPRIHGELLKLGFRGLCVPKTSSDVTVTSEPGKGSMFTVRLPGGATS